MSEINKFTKLIPARSEDVEEAVAFYNQQIEAIHQDPRRATKWSPFNPGQIINIIENPHSDLLLLREQVGRVAGNIVGGVIVDKDFSAWSPQEIFPPNPRHFAKFLAKQGLGRSALWPALLEYGKANDISSFVAEAWNFAPGGRLPEDKLHAFYTDPEIGMEWHGTVIYKNNYYGDIIGAEQLVNRFMYDLHEPRPPKDEFPPNNWL